MRRQVVFTKTRQESFPVVTITWDDKLYRFVVTREDVNQTLGLPLDHKFGMGFLDTEMTTIAERLGEAYAELGDRWVILRDISDTVLRGEL